MLMFIANRYNAGILLGEPKAHELFTQQEKSLI